MPGIRHFIEALLNPFFLFFLWLLICLVLLYLKGSIKVVRICFGIGFLYLLIISTGFLPQFLTKSIESQYKSVKKIDPSIHWVVVLSGGQADASELPVNAVLYSASLRRVMEGVRLFHLLPEAKLLLSGGGYGADRPESTRLSEVAEMMGISTKAMVLELYSVNTADQARALEAIVNHEPFYLVTSALHMRRAIALCKKQGLKPIPAPTDYTLYWQDERWEKRWLPNPSNMLYLSIAMHEYLGWYWGRLLGEL